jgi:nicotinate-nucleotide adenylyltransferase
MRLGICGGSFDPVHFGHLLLAETCREQCGLDQVWFVPAAVPPHKQARLLAQAKDRVEMLRLAVAGNDALRVSTLEIERGGVSFTVDTLQAVAEAEPGAALFFLMGADSLRDLPNWRDPARICQQAIPVVVRRSGAPEPDWSVLQGVVSPTRIEEIRRHQVKMPILELSSTRIREAVSQGRSIRFQTPRAVEAYISEHRLYQPNGGEA